MQQQKITPNQTTDSLPAIPDKLYFTIGEVAKLYQLKPHVLRYWEEEFVQLSPVKRKGNRRYYQRKDVILIWRIKELLHVQGFTIEGARTKLLSENHSTDSSLPLKALQKTIIELENLLLVLQA